MKIYIASSWKNQHMVEALTDQLEALGGEVGAAFGAGVPVYGLWAKGEPIGLNRWMVSMWLRDYRELVRMIGQMMRCKAVRRVRPREES